MTVTVDAGQYCVHIDIDITFFLFCRMTDLFCVDVGVLQEHTGHIESYG